MENVCGSPQFSLNYGSWKDFEMQNRCGTSPLFLKSENCERLGRQEVWEACAKLYPPALLNYDAGSNREFFLHDGR